jgi:hypothetical protein
MVIASASRSEDPGFESRLGVRFVGIFYIAMHCFSVYLKKIDGKKKYTKRNNHPK